MNATSQWQPIETAPKEDRVEVDLCGYRFHRRQGQWAGVMRFESRKPIGYLVSGTTDKMVKRRKFTMITFTHWMPLPDPPTTQPKEQLSDDDNN